MGHASWIQVEIWTRRWRKTQSLSKILALNKDKIQTMISDDNQSWTGDLSDLPLSWDDLLMQLGLPHFEQVNFIKIVLIRSFHQSKPTNDPSRIQSKPTTFLGWFGTKTKNHSPPLRHPCFLYRMAIRMAHHSRGLICIDPIQTPSNLSFPKKWKLTLASKDTLSKFPQKYLQQWTLMDWSLGISSEEDVPSPDSSSINRSLSNATSSPAKEFESRSSLERFDAFVPRLIL